MSICDLMYSIYDLQTDYMEQTQYTIIIGTLSPLHLASNHFSAWFKATLHHDKQY